MSTVYVYIPVTKKLQTEKYVKYSFPQLVGLELQRSKMYEIWYSVIACDCVSGISLNCAHPTYPLAPSPDSSVRIYVLSVATDPLPLLPPNWFLRVTNRPATAPAAATLWECHNLSHRNLVATVIFPALYSVLRKTAILLFLVLKHWYIRQSYEGDSPYQFLYMGLGAGNWENDER